jgi:hypothetical protein
MDKDRSFIFNLNRKSFLRVKPSKRTTLFDPAFGPIFGDSDFKIKGKKCYSNYHIYNNSF